MDSKRSKNKSIIHLDMDAFYPAVEVLDNPALKGKPVIVGGSVERGVVSSASYEARAYGVHSAQPIATARKLCPKAVFLPVRMNRYRDVSKQIFEIFYRFTPLVEPLSIDEAFLDVTGCRRLFGSAAEMARQIKAAVRNETRLTISAGIAPSKFVAKIASDMDKPDGLTLVPSDSVSAFLDPLPIGKMWGAGKVMQKTLARMNIHTFKDLRLADPGLLERKLGIHGTHMQLLAMGLDERDVIPVHEIKSVGHELTFREDILSLDEARKKLLSLAMRVGHRMRAKKLLGKTVSLKVKYHDFRQITRSETLPRATDDGHQIYKDVCRLLTKTGVGQKPVRLLGISMSNLTPTDQARQLSLFESPSSFNKRKELNRALDSITYKHGSQIVQPAALFTDKWNEKN